MVLEAEIRIPKAPGLDLREMVLLHAPKEGEDACPQCGADRFHLLDALFDQNCWENRGLATNIIESCLTCRHELIGIVARAGHIFAHNGTKTGKRSNTREMV